MQINELTGIGMIECPQIFVQKTSGQWERIAIYATFSRRRASAMTFSGVFGWKGDFSQDQPLGSIV
jgi:hypothetical protein